MVSLERQGSKSENTESENNASRGSNGKGSEGTAPKNIPSGNDDDVSGCLSKVDRFGSVINAAGLCLQEVHQGVSLWTEKKVNADVARALVPPDDLVRMARVDASSIIMRAITRLFP